MNILDKILNILSEEVNPLYGADFIDSEGRMSGASTETGMERKKDSDHPKTDMQAKAEYLTGKALLNHSNNSSEQNENWSPVLDEIVFSNLVKEKVTNVDALTTNNILVTPHTAHFIERIVEKMLIDDGKTKIEGKTVYHENIEIKVVTQDPSIKKKSDDLFYTALENLDPGNVKFNRLTGAYHASDAYNVHFSRSGFSLEISIPFDEANDDFIKEIYSKYGLSDAEKDLVQKSAKGNKLIVKVDVNPTSCAVELKEYSPNVVFSSHAIKTDGIGSLEKFLFSYDLLKRMDQRGHYVYRTDTYGSYIPRLNLIDLVNEAKKIKQFNVPMVKRIKTKDGQTINSVDMNVSVEAHMLILSDGFTPVAYYPKTNRLYMLENPAKDDKYNERMGNYFTMYANGEISIEEFGAELNRTNDDGSMYYDLKDIKTMLILLDIDGMSNTQPVMYKLMYKDTVDVSFRIDVSQLFSDHDVSNLFEEFIKNCDNINHLRNFCDSTFNYETFKSIVYNKDANGEYVYNDKIDEVKSKILEAWKKKVSSGFIPVDPSYTVPGAKRFANKKDVKTGVRYQKDVSGKITAFSETKVHNVLKVSDSGMSTYFKIKKTPSSYLDCAYQLDAVDFAMRNIINVTFFKEIKNNKDLSFVNIPSYNNIVTGSNGKVYDNRADIKTYVENELQRISKNYKSVITTYDNDIKTAEKEDENSKAEVDKNKADEIRKNADAIRNNAETQKERSINLIIDDLHVLSQQLFDPMFIEKWKKEIITNDSTKNQTTLWNDYTALINKINECVKVQYPNPISQVNGDSYLTQTEMRNIYSDISNSNNDATKLYKNLHRGMTQMFASLERTFRSLEISQQTRLAISDYSRMVNGKPTFVSNIVEDILDSIEPFEDYQQFFNRSATKLSAPTNISNLVGSYMDGYSTYMHNTYPLTSVDIPDDERVKPISFYDTDISQIQFLDTNTKRANGTQKKDSINNLKKVIDKLNTSKPFSVEIGENDKKTFELFKDKVLAKMQEWFAPSDGIWTMLYQVMRMEKKVFTGGNLVPNPKSTLTPILCKISNISIDGILKDGHTHLTSVPASLIDAITALKQQSNVDSGITDISNGFLIDTATKSIFKKLFTHLIPAINSTKAEAQKQLKSQYPIIGYSGPNTSYANQPIHTIITSYYNKSSSNAVTDITFVIISTMLYDQEKQNPIHYAYDYDTNKFAVTNPDKLKSTDVIDHELEDTALTANLATLVKHRNISEDESDFINLLMMQAHEAYNNILLWIANNEQIKNAKTKEDIKNVFNSEEFKNELMNEKMSSIKSIAIYLNLIYTLTH